MTSPTTRRTTLAQGLDLHNNALNFLRLILASLVIVSHTRPLAGWGDDPHFGKMKLGTIAVAGFFAVSGFLVSGSRLRQRGRNFLIRRFARIFPGYWLCSIITVFGIAAVIGAKRGGWSLVPALKSFASGLGIAGWHGTIGDTLVGAPVTSTLNGSLWTLPYEIFCYLMLAGVVSIVFIRRRLRFWSLLGVAGMTLLGVAAGLHGHTSGLLELVCFFTAGVALNACKDSVELSSRMALLAALVTAGAFQSTATELFAALPFAYLCLWFGAVCPQRLKNIGHKNDISYGVYLYGWPVQQAVTAFHGARLGYAGYTAVALAIAIPFAWASWLLVERPSINYAKRRTSAQAQAEATKPVERGRHYLATPRKVLDDA